MYYMLLTLWLSQPEVEKRSKLQPKRGRLQDNKNETELTITEKTDNILGKEDGSCR